MKTPNLKSFFGSMIFLILAVPAFAGTLTITSGPTYTPNTAFTNNTIAVQVFSNPPGVTGDLAKITGGVTVTPPGSNTASVEAAGNYSANVGDIASLAYSFTADMNVTVPVTYTMSGTATIFGSPQTFTDTGTILPGLRQYVGVRQAPIGFPIPSSGPYTFKLTLNFGSANGPDGAAPGTVDLQLEQFGFQLATTPAANLPPTKALNISTRLGVETADNALIAGVINSGPASKRVLIRGIGPSLASSFTGVLANPTLELNQGSTLLAQNNDWRSTQESEIQATGIPPTDNLESAIVYDLPQGAFTAVLRGVNNTTGIGLVEIYDVDQAANARLANISTRGLVGTGNNVMIGGFILGPNTNGFSTVVVRGIGPSLTEFGVPGALQNPTLELHDSNGTVTASNDNWMDGANQQRISTAGLAPTNANESALLAIPVPGSYTAILGGANNTTGVGLVEVYQFLTLP